MRLVTYNGNPYNFALQFLDPDQLDTNYYLYKMQNGNEIRMGVEVDPYGKPVAYHFWNRHPAESTVRPLARVRISADEIIPLYLPERVMQSRGVSPMVPSILSMHMLGKYSEAELVAARVGAAKMGFFEATADDTQYTGERDEEQRIKMNAEAGTIEQLPQGLTFKAWDPQHPAVQNGFKTQTDIMAENGDDFEEGIDQIKYEQDYVKAAGVKLGTDVKGIADTADDDQSAQNGSNTQQKNAAQEKEES